MHEGKYNPPSRELVSGEVRVLCNLHAACKKHGTQSGGSWGDAQNARDKSRKQRQPAYVGTGINGFGELALPCGL
jgi:hypothetical protein